MSCRFRAAERGPAMKRLALAAAALIVLAAPADAADRIKLGFMSTRSGAGGSWRCCRQSSDARSKRCSATTPRPPAG